MERRAVDVAGVMLIMVGVVKEGLMSEEEPVFKVVIEQYEVEKKRKRM